MGSEPSAGAPTRTRAAGGRLWQLLPVDWGRVQEVTNEPVPGHIKRWWFALGGTPAYLFFIQITTGILLSFYYVPSPDHAYESVSAITGAVPFGWFVRSIHKWAANLMIITVILHMCRVYFSCAFRHPRQVNWVIGCGLLMGTLMLGFTGYSLVYEQLSYWGITVACELTSVAPFVGDTLASFMRGGEEVGPNTLTRMFNLHVGILPVAMVIMIGLHIAVLRLHGVSDLSFKNPGRGKGTVPISPGSPGENGAAEIQPCSRSGRNGDSPRAHGATADRLLGVKLVALVAALIALGCIVMAAVNPVRVRLIAHELTLGGSRVFWMITAATAATAAVLLLRGHMYGLFIWLVLSILAVGKLAFDLVNREPGHFAGWIVAAVVLAVTAVYGAARQDRFVEGKGEDKPFSFYPDHLMTELVIGTLLLFLLSLLSLVFPAGLGEKANPLMTPEHIKPEWYFFFQFRLLKLVGLNTAVMLTGFIAGLLVLWPWADALLEKIAPGKDLGVYIGIVVFLTFLTFTVWEAMV